MCWAGYLLHWNDQELASDSKHIFSPSTGEVRIEPVTSNFSLQVLCVYCIAVYCWSPFSSNFQSRSSVSPVACTFVSCHESFSISLRIWPCVASYPDNRRIQIATLCNTAAFSRTLHYHIQDELLWETPLYRSCCGYSKISVRESNCSSFECFVLYLIFLRINPLALVRLMISSLASGCFIFLSPLCSSNRAI